MSGCLFVVSTPIGHLDDLSARARIVLEQADWVACEDTRHSGRMLASLGISTKLISYHDHNEQARTATLLKRLEEGQVGALISDAGTPLLSDPGYVLVRACQQVGIQPVPVPGASALLAALAVSGLPTDRFQFRGFLPPKGNSRADAISGLLKQTSTVIVYESPNRLLDLLEAIARLTPRRELVLCRELTKQFETVCRMPAAELHDFVRVDTNQQRGEIVLLVAPADGQQADDSDLEKLAGLLAGELPPSRTAKVLANWSGRKRQEIYQLLERLPHKTGD